MKKLLSNKLIQQILKFGVVGVLCFAIDFGTMTALKELLGVSTGIATSCGFTVSVVVNYLLSITVVFETDKKANKGAQFVIFVVLSLIGLGINDLIVIYGERLLAPYLSKGYMLAKIVATGVVMVYNFITRKIFIEKH